ncbi:MAG: D-alanyl-D-alanine carboxypeptidase family protein [Leptolyngbyaceae cyanobacterium bins.349]|nr:D-alanyl-D-alanine carboxypeptidase family protein [Leptolyngbyaceae cyanobacterium bins.349]
MDKVTATDNAANIVARVTDDIPIAQRETPTPVSKTTFKKSYLVGALAIVGMLAAGAGALASLQLQRSQLSAASMASVTTQSAQAKPSPAPTATASPAAATDSILGHMRYPEAPASALMPIVADGSIKLRKTAAQAYQEMEAAARRDGVILAPISGFRSLDDQNYLFFGKKAERGQVAAERAKVSAPPGYSEHHTGYAIDIGDGNVPATHLSESFENTPAFRWLKANAAFYSFEISFPKGNKQGVNYEPWHWRFVGDRDSLETFYKARAMK